MIVGLERADDAGVYLLKDDTALIQTLDFFTPIVDDPYTFGLIAAANAFSDIYAMGGKPITAMNIVCFPTGKMDISILREILRGGLEKIEEAGAVLLGGHSVEDDELKYGLSVTGVIHPEKVVKNTGAKVGDFLILTKPIGTGIVNTALKGDMVDDDQLREATEIMVQLNDKASHAMVEVGVNACTDITGFGLLGHALEMVEGTDVGLKIYVDKVPLIKGVVDLAQMGLVPGGTYRNKEFRRSFLVFERKIEEYMLDILFDPQTSGGLLISVPGSKLERLLGAIREKGADAWVIGEVVEEPKGRIAIS